MDNTIKPLSHLLLLIILVCGLSFQASYVSGVSTSSVPEFTLEYVNNSIEATIKNNLGASYYNLRFKGQNENEWRYYPHDPASFAGYNHYNGYANSIPCQASNSSYTVVTLPSSFFQNFPIGGDVDVQVQALFGPYQIVPYGASAPGGFTYDFYFEGTVSDWSNTQTFSFAENAVIPEFPSWTILPIILTITLFSVIIKGKMSKCVRTT